MQYKRMPIEVESPEELGYGNIRYNLSESSVADQSLGGLGLVVPDLTLLYGEHRGSLALRSLIVADASGLAADEVLITGGAAGRALHRLDLPARHAGPPGGGPPQLCDQSGDSARHRLPDQLRRSANSMRASGWI